MRQVGNFQTADKFNLSITSYKSSLSVQINFGDSKVSILFQRTHMLNYFKKFAKIGYKNQMVVEMIINVLKFK
jgi:hypothetical protein